MATAGRILIIPKGEYDASAKYEMLDLVNYSGIPYLAKKTSVGIAPTNTEYWHPMIGIAIANNLNTETEGYVLDARQGKALMDMITTKHTVFNPSNCSPHDNYNGCYYTKSGNTVHVHIGVKGLTANGQRTVVFNLPAEVRPIRLVSAFGLSDSELNTFALGYIEPSGDIGIRSNTEYACLEFNYNV